MGPMRAEEISGFRKWDRNAIKLDRREKASFDVRGAFFKLAVEFRLSLPGEETETARGEFFAGGTVLFVQGGDIDIVEVTSEGSGT